MPEYTATRRDLVRTAASLPLAMLLTASPARGATVTPCPASERRVGIAYSLWHRNQQWQKAAGPHKPWGEPELGFYRSDDTAILTRHAGWLSGAGVDFVVVDWSNDLGMDVRRPGGPASQRFIETATETLFQTWGALPAAPRVVLMIGAPGDKAALRNGQLTAKANEVHALFVADAVRARLLQRYLGKPLLLVYVGTPSPWPNGLPPWRDDRFTVRFVTGFVTQQRTLLGPGRVSKYGYWSWEDRGQPSYPVFDGHPENMTVVAAWRGKGSPGRDGGRTYIRQWEDARRVGPRFVLGGTFNEWWISEQISPGDSKDIEPSREFGWRYMDILKQQATLFKQGK